MKQLPVTALLLFLLIGAWTALADDPQVFEDHVTFFSSETSTAFGSNVLATDFNDIPTPDLIITESYHGEDWHGRMLVYFDIETFENGQYNATTDPADVIFIGEWNDRLGLNAASCDFNGDGTLDFLFNRTSAGDNDSLIFILFGGQSWTSGILIEDIDSEADIIIIPNEENEDDFGTLIPG